MPDQLFNRGDLRSFLINHGQELNQEISSLSEHQILNSSPNDLGDHFVQKYLVDTIEINETGIQADVEDTQVDVSHRMEYTVFNQNRTIYAKGTRIIFYVPFTGDPQLFRYNPSKSQLGSPCADIRNNELVFVYESTAQDPERIKRGIENEFDHDLSNIKFNTNEITKDSQNFNSNLRQKVTLLIEARREKFLQDRGIAESLGVPIRRWHGIPTTYTAPEVKRRIVPQIPPVSTKPYMPEPTLEMAEYDHILSVVSNMVVVMERSPRAFKDMGEEDLRQHFLVQLNGQYEGQATGETFNYEGKTDILIRANDKNIFIAECKFWTGPSGLTEALNQLLVLSQTCFRW